MPTVYFPEFTIQKITTKRLGESKLIDLAIGKIGNINVTVLFPNKIPSVLKPGMKIFFNGKIISTYNNEMEIVINPGFDFIRYSNELISDEELLA